eukprot:CAMPEP_0118664414 /NCGR_PEP_ID=MMETSP0785-20121206/17999_1 /TAXON_ID=91992 /ORGANISM="Bolidomonas pacifica, Strain CCMP 1866" /LENGTH=32 /DNA_ID= /DNA_START= /DNA_END= /DNA_ORIENTATION=
MSFFSSSTFAISAACSLCSSVAVIPSSPSLTL